MFVCVCVKIWMSTRVGVNVFAIQKLAKLEICRFFLLLLFFLLWTKTWKWIWEWRIQCTFFKPSQRGRKIDPNPEWASIIHTSAYITALMTSYVVLFKAEYKLSPAVYIQTNSGVKLSFPLNIFKKTSTHWMQLGPQRPRMKHTLKPAWIIIIIIIIMPQSVCSQVWQIPQTWGQNWVLRSTPRNEMILKYTTQKKKNKRKRLKVMFVFNLLNASHLMIS